MSGKIHSMPPAVCSFIFVLSFAFLMNDLKPAMAEDQGISKVPYSSRREGSLLSVCLKGL